MHHNYYFLRLLAQRLTTSLSGYEVAVCFSQQKDELVIGLTNGTDDQWIKASLLSEFCALSFPDDFRRTRQNSVDLFRSLIGRHIHRAYTFANERCLAFELDQDYTLVFKLFGARANVLLFAGQEVESVFHQKYPKDFDLRLSALERPIDQQREAFLRQGLKATFPTFDRDMTQWLDDKGFGQMNAEGQWNLLQGFLDKLTQPNFYICQKGDDLRLLLFETGQVLWQGQDPVAAANEFYHRYARAFFYEKIQQDVLRRLEKKAESALSYLQKSREKLNELLHHSRYEEMANILMANLHQVPTRSNRVTLFDFYRDKELEIKLNENLSPQKNAESYYRKAKNQKIEIQKIEENVRRKEQEWLDLQAVHAEIAAVQGMKDLKKALKQHGLDQDREEEERFPFRRFEYEGFDIWVGKNAQNNDLLIQRYAHKEDLWLHARDATGSHVLLRRLPGKTFPPKVIERAAALAAYYSQRRHETLCPVIYTPRKFIRKTKDLAPGQVIVDKEQVLMIEPQGPSNPA